MTARGICTFRCVLVLASIALFCCESKHRPVPGDQAHSAVPVPSAASDTTDDQLLRMLTRDASSEAEVAAIERELGEVRSKEIRGERSNADVWFAGLTPEEVATFLAALKKAVRDKDRRKVAQLVEYPTQTRLDGKGKLVDIHDADEFVAKYDRIMTKRVLDAIRSATPSTVSASWRGVSLARGAVWFNGICVSGPAHACTKYVLRITRINNHPIPGEPPGP
jgi:hypothetical protein